MSFFSYQSFVASLTFAVSLQRLNNNHKKERNEKGHDGNDLLRKIHRAAKVQMEYFVEVIDIQLFNIQITFGVGSAYVVYKLSLIHI